jgi:hypothetical protein
MRILVEAVLEIVSLSLMIHSRCHPAVSFRYLSRPHSLQERRALTLNMGWQIAAT